MVYGAVFGTFAACLATLREAIAPCWHDALVRMGMPADPSPQQVEVWQASRRASPALRTEIVETIARRAAGERVVAIAEQALRLWRAGVEVEEIAARVGVPPSRLRRWVTHGALQLTPQRLRPAQLVDRFGWSPGLVALYRRRGVLPSPDGVRRGRGGYTVPWWWASTIARVEDEVLTHLCEVCGARLATAKGRANHRTLTHRDAAASDPAEGSAPAHAAQDGRVP